MVGLRNLAIELKLEKYAVSGTGHYSLCFGESYKLHMKENDMNHTG